MHLLFQITGIGKQVVQEPDREQVLLQVTIFENKVVQGTSIEGKGVQVTEREQCVDQVNGIEKGLG